MSSSTFDLFISGVANGMREAAAAASRSAPNNSPPAAIRRGEISAVDNENGVYEVELRAANGTVADTVKAMRWQPGEQYAIGDAVLIAREGGSPIPILVGLPAKQVRPGRIAAVNGGGSYDVYLRDWTDENNLLLLQGLSAWPALAVEPAVNAQCWVVFGDDGPCVGDA
jgi:hypothetical protein